MTNDSRLAQRMTIYCERGNDSYALSEMQAAVLIPQLERLHHDNAIRRDAASRLSRELLQFDWIHAGLDTAGNLPAFYKFGIRIQPAILESTKVQQFVRESEHEITNALAVARAFVLKHMERVPISIGTGFKGFANRSNGRCRRAGSLENSIAASNETLVLHHSHLLDPETGASTTDHVLAALNIMNQERFH